MTDTVSNYNSEKTADNVAQKKGESVEVETKEREIYACGKLLATGSERSRGGGKTPRDERKRVKGYR